MDETTELLKLVLSRLGELSAKVDGMDRRLDGIDSRLDGVDRRLDGIDSRLDGVDRHMVETNGRLSVIEQRLDYYRDKWMEHDEEIWALKHRQT